MNEIPEKAQKAIQDTVATTFAAMEKCKKKGNPICITLLNTDAEGNVLVAADTKDQVARLHEMINLTATVLCKHCKNLPCLVDIYYDGIVCWGEEMENDEDVNNEYGGHPNNVICFTIYSKLVEYIFGHLGKGNRKKLPQCLVSEIHDFWRSPIRVGDRVEKRHGLSWR